MTGQVTAHFDDLPQVPFDDFQLHLFASDRGLMATPTRCTIYSDQRPLLPLEHDPGRSELDAGLRARRRSPRQPSARVRSAPSTRASVAGTSNPVAGAFTRLHPEARPRRRRPVPRQPQLHDAAGPHRRTCAGSPTAPRRRSPHAAQNPGPDRAGDPELPGLLADRHHQRRRRPGHPPLPRGRQDVSGRARSRARRCRLVAITPALAGPYDYGTVVVRVALHVDPLDAHVIADSETVPSIIGGVPIRMRSIQVNIDKPELHDQPDQLLAVLGRLAGDRRPGHGRPPSPPTSTRQLRRRSPFKPKMTITQLGGGKAHRPLQEPELPVRPRHPRRRRQHQIARGHPLERLRDRPAPPGQHLLRGRTGNANQCAGRQPIGTATTTTPLLDQPLTGPVYAVSGYGGLPRACLHPQRPGDAHPAGPNRRRSKAAACRPPSRSSPTRRSGTSASPSSAAKRATWPTPAASAARPVIEGRIHRPKRQDPDPEGRRSRPHAAERKNDPLATTTRQAPEL